MTILRGPGLYVLECLGRLKVGVSAVDVEQRLYSFTTTLPAPSTLRWVLTHASRVQEKELHERLRKWHAHREWFYLDPESEEVISAFAHEWDARKSKAQSGIPVFITLAQFAELAKISHRTAWRWAVSGKMSAMRIGKHWRVCVRDLLATHPALYESFYSDSGPLVGRAIRFTGDRL